MNADSAPSQEGGVDNWRTCSLETNSASLYKYTIASTYAADDAKWAADLFGCKRFTLSYTCEPEDHVGKTTCSTMDLHFIYNENTEEGPTDIKTWDDYQVIRPCQVDLRAIHATF